MGRRGDLSRLSGAAFDPVHSAVVGRVSIWAVRHTVRIDHDLSDNPDSVLDLAVDGLFQDNSLRARGMCVDRWRESMADHDQDRAAARSAGADFGFHFLLHAVLE